MCEPSNNLSRHDLQSMEVRILRGVKELVAPLYTKNEQKQATYTVKQFAKATGLTEACVLQRCQRGKLEARQDGPGCRWTINGDELDRYLQEGKKNQW